MMEQSGAREDFKRMVCIQYMVYVIQAVFVEKLEGGVTALKDVRRIIFNVPVKLIQQFASFYRIVAQKDTHFSKEKEDVNTIAFLMGTLGVMKEEHVFQTMGNVVGSWKSGMNIKSMYSQKRRLLQTR